MSLGEATLDDVLTFVSTKNRFSVFTVRVSLFLHRRRFAMRQQLVRPVRITWLIYVFRFVVSHGRIDYFGKILGFKRILGAIFDLPNQNTFSVEHILTGPTFCDMC